MTNLQAIVHTDNAHTTPQNYNKNYSGNINLGCLLMEFFELYGRCFNFFNSAIFVTKKGGYRMKLNSGDGQKSSIITIDDPIDKGACLAAWPLPISLSSLSLSADNDVAKSCFGLFNIRHSFANAYCLLSSCVIPACIVANNGGSSAVAMDSSILASIICVSAASIKFREDIQTKFAALVNADADKIRFVLPLPAESVQPMNGVKTPRRTSRRTTTRKLFRC